jgi:hypothetical protein
MWCLLSCKWEVGCMKVGWSSSWWWDAKQSFESFFHALFFLLFSCVVCKVHVCSSPSSWLAPFACCMPTYPHHHNTTVTCRFFVCVQFWHGSSSSTVIYVVTKIIHSHLTPDSLAGICRASMLLSHGAGITSNFCPYWQFRNENWMVPSCWKPRFKTDLKSSILMLGPRQCINSQSLENFGLAVVCWHVTADWLLKKCRPLYVSTF